MTSLSLGFAVLAALVLIAEAGGHGQGQMEGESRMARGGWPGQQGQQQRQQGQQQGQQGRRQGVDQWQGGNRDEQQGWNQGRQGGADSRYRSNILDDDDVYGYEAKYPNGEVLFVNYRNSEARGRRGPDFARSNSISARMSGNQQGQQEGGFRQQGQQSRMGGFRQQRSGMEEQHGQ